MMTAETATWRDSAVLDDLFMNLAEGHPGAIAALLNVLRTAPPEPLVAWPAETAAAWRAGLDLALESLDRSQLRPCCDLFLALCDIGYDSPLFRDLVSGMVRQTRPDYLDPAGLLTALGLREPAVSTTAIASRWRLFEVLRPGVLCYHPPHGLGTVEAVDSLANDIRVRQNRLYQMSLKVALTQATLVRPASWLLGLIKGEAGARQRLRPDDFFARAVEGLVAPQAPDAELLKAILVPVALSAEQFAALRKPAAPATATATATAEAAPEATAETTAGTRTWDQARGITEMAGLIAATETLQDQGADTANVAAILRTDARRGTHVNDWVATLALLQQAFGSAPWFTAVLQELGPEAVCWNDPAIFVDQSDRLPGRLVSHWFEATATARGPAYLAQACMGLPLRLWTHAERIVGQRAGAENPTLFLDTAVHEITRGTPSADTLVWAYRQGGDTARLLANPPLLFKTLQRPVRGSFIKSRKDLHKLVMDDQAFQRLVMRDGDPEGVVSLVRCVRHSPLLDAGERQSLLVKIVRVFPEAIALVEDRRAQVTRKPIGKITSIRSFQRHRRELEDIVSRRIPANAQAIAHARSYGDLRENAEYKAAKDEQALLRARREELENALHEVRATDFADVTAPECVVPGCAVTLRYPDGRQETCQVLGLWDSIPERRMVSYDTPFGRALIGARSGDTITLPGGDSVTLTAVAPLDGTQRAWLCDTRPDAE